MSVVDPGDLAELVREYLQREDLTQSAFAAQAGLSPATVTRLLKPHARPLSAQNLDKIRGAVPPAFHRWFAQRLRRPTLTSPGGKGVRRVFLSSTFLDLEDRRSLVMRAVESFPNLKCTAMERFTASTRPAVEDCLRAVRESDLYVGILAYRYGWIPQGMSKSITELEHDAALEAGIERLMFVVDSRRRAMNVETDMDSGEERWTKAAQLDGFKKRLGATGITPRPFGTDAELVQLVNQALREWSGDAAAAPKVELRHEELGRYRGALLAEHSHLAMVGFATNVRVSMGLEELFVPLRACREPFRDGPDKRERRRDLAEATRREFEGEARLPFAVDPEDAAVAGGATVFSRARELDRRVLVVLGEPGSGKTSQFRRLAHAALTRDAGAILRLHASAKTPLLPVFVPLRKVPVDVLRRGLGAVIHHTLPQHAGLDPAFCDWLVDERRHLLVLLDGLDEVPADLRDDVAGWVRSLAEDETSWFVLSSRPRGYTDDARKALDGRAFEVKIQEFEDEDVEAFVRRWYAIVARADNPIGWEVRAEAAASDLLGRLRARHDRASRVLEMTANPLLLTVICLIHKDRGSHLPEHRERLYRESAEVLLERWRQAKGLDLNLSADAARNVLEPVAGLLHRTEGRTSATAAELAKLLAEPLRAGGWTGTPEAFLLYLRDDSGILCGESNDAYRFLHLGLQEYFAARELRGRFAELAYENREGADALLDALVERFGSSWWREVFLLLFAIPEKPYLFVPFFERLIDERPALLAEQEGLIGDCVREGLGVSPRPFTAFLDREVPVVPRRHEEPIAAAVRLVMECGDAALRSLLGPERAHLLVRHAPRPTARLVLDLISKHAPERSAELEALFAGREESAPANERVAPRSAHEKLVYAASGVTLVRIPGGSFEMGGRAHADEKPPHSVRVSDFWLAETPVTNAQYRAFVDATGRAAPSSWRDRDRNADDQPVVSVTWEDAQAFCRWAGLRLPSEAEWEYACRARTTSEYWFGDDEEQLADYGWFDGNSGGELQSVGRKPASPFGLFDMHGNVWEWCQDEWHDSYKGAPGDGSAWETGGSGLRVGRGGGFRSSAWFARSACRVDCPPEFRVAVLGFRPARSPD